MVLGPVVESDGVTNSGCNVLWVELDVASLGTDGNDVVCCKGSASKGSSEDGGV